MQISLTLGLFRFIIFLKQIESVSNVCLQITAKIIIFTWNILIYRFVNAFNQEIIPGIGVFVILLR